VSNHVQTFREAVKDLLIAIAIDHLLAVPEGVVEVPAVVHRGIETQALSIHRVSLVRLHVKVIGVAGILVSFVDSGVRRIRVALAPYQLSRKHGLVLSVVDGAPLLAGGQADGGEVGQYIPMAAQALGRGQGAQGSLPVFRVFGQMSQNVRRYNATNVAVHGVLLSARGRTSLCGSPWLLAEKNRSAKNRKDRKYPDSAQAIQWPSRGCPNPKPHRQESV
jgi:hypothetical protein